MKWTETRIATALTRLPLSRHPGFSWSHNQEGYREYVFGARAGPAYSIGFLLHELAHAIEFGPENFEQRCHPTGFIFHVPTVWVYDRYCVEPTTNQGTQRECRTVGIQYLLERCLGRKAAIGSIIDGQLDSFRFLADSHFAQPEQCKQWTLEAIDTYSITDILTRLEGWLDLTQQRLSQP